MPVIATMTTRDQDDQKETTGLELWYVFFSFSFFLTLLNILKTDLHVPKRS